jgi:hypothetical protein
MRLAVPTVAALLAACAAVAVATEEPKAPKTLDIILSQPSKPTPAMPPPKLDEKTKKPVEHKAPEVR